MVENWINIIEEEDKCRLTFLDSCHIILDDDDVKYLINGLMDYLLFKEIMVKA